MSIYGADAYKEILNDCSKSGEPVVKEIMNLTGNKLILPKGVSNINEHWDQGKLKYEYQRAYDNYWLSTSKITPRVRPIYGLIWPFGHHAHLSPRHSEGRYQYYCFT